MPEQEIARQVRAAEDLRFRAMLAGDAGALAELLSDRVVYTHSSGTRDTKPSLLAKITEGSLVYLAAEHPVGEIIVLGEAVLVFGEMHADVVLAGVPRRLDNATLAVWAMQDGAWRLAAFQPTPLPG